MAGSWAKTSWTIPDPKSLNLFPLPLSFVARKDLNVQDINRIFLPSSSHRFTLRHSYRISDGYTIRKDAVTSSAVFDRSEAPGFNNKTKQWSQIVQAILSIQIESG